MIRDYLHVLKNLPGILARIERDLASKASTASVDTLRYTVGRKADQTYVTKLAETASDRLSKTVALDDHNVVISIINERLSERPTHADIVLVKEELGVRLDGVEREIETLALNAVKTGEPNLKTLSVNVDTSAVSDTLDVLRDLVDRGEITPKEGNARLAAIGEGILPPLGHTGIIITKARKPRAPKGGAK